jgi:S-adenosylmethionine hydrolase
MAFPLITLTTDFGRRDGYVAAMKGVILGICPEASIVDISHDIEPQDVAQAALVLSFAAPYFPAHAIHVAVVDPEVGSDRRPLLLTAMSGRYVGPDNGIFTHVMAERDLPASEMAAGNEAVPVEAQLPVGCAAFILDRPKFRLSPLSRTFHGRDLFAPVAAYLAHGTSPEDLGTETDYYNVLPLPRPREGPGRVDGNVIHVDRFGNMVTNIRLDGASAAVQVEVAGRTISGLSLSYHEGGELLAIVGSHGYLEVAWWQDSAARRLGAKVGTPVTVLGIHD